MKSKMAQLISTSQLTHGQEFARIESGNRVEFFEAEKQLFKRAKKYFLDRKSGVLQDTATVVTTMDDQRLFAFASYIEIDLKFGVRNRAIALLDLGRDNNLVPLLEQLESIFDKQLKEVQMEFFRESGRSLSFAKMPVSVRVLIYTNHSDLTDDEVSNAFDRINYDVEVLAEDSFLKTVFVSFGGPSVLVAKKINEFLVSRGVQTYFFPVNALPGEKLHRVMHDGVNKYDRVLLLCSKESLTRPGVLNELERVFEREAREGGSDILLPLTLDDFVYTDWAPDRKDIAEQVRSRVVTKVDPKAILKGRGDDELEKVVLALRKVA